jgi:hypothetical protein
LHQYISTSLLFRFLVLVEDGADCGTARYLSLGELYLTYGCPFAIQSPAVEILKAMRLAGPERPMVRLNKGDHVQVALTAETFVMAKVVDVDASLVRFADDRSL